MTDQVYTIVFDGVAGDMTDTVIQKAVRAAGGEIISCGTFLAGRPQRDVEFSVPAEHALALVSALKRFGLEAKARLN